METVNSPPRLLDRVRAALRVRNMALRTEQAYVDWIRRFILFHGKRHPDEMGAEEVAAAFSPKGFRPTWASACRSC